MRRFTCPACNAIKHGVKTRVAIPHTCQQGEESRVGYCLPNGGHATFTQEPDQKTLDALNEMVNIAKKNLKKDD